MREPAGWRRGPWGVISPAGGEAVDEFCCFSQRHFRGDDAVERWARMEAKSDSTRDDLRRRVAPHTEKAPVGTPLITAAVEVAAWLFQGSFFDR